MDHVHLGQVAVARDGHVLHLAHLLAMLVVDGLELQPVSRVAGGFGSEAGFKANSSIFVLLGSPIRALRASARRTALNAGQVQGA